jgi:pyruvate formate lyase activating enzyme
LPKEVILETREISRPMEKSSDYGTIFNIQRYSIQDGNGIRTTVFFKGCPLHCVWCSNPESLSPASQFLYSIDNCVHCGSCVACCIFGARNQPDSYDPQKCTFCLKCVQNCPTGALEISGRQLSADEIMNEILKDLIFFQNSGGGVTFSGGEVLLQWQFASALAKRIKENGIDLAIETSGNAKWENAEQLFIHCDHILFDIKLMDEERHRKYTGVSNSLILSNAVKANKIVKRFTVRLPLIGGINDDKENIINTGNFMQKNGMKEIHFLPYHRFGEKKYEKIGTNYLFKAYTPTEDHMKYLKCLLNDLSISVQIGGA